MFKVGDRVTLPSMRMAYKMWEIPGWNVGHVLKIIDRDCIGRAAPNGLTLYVDFSNATCAESGTKVGASWYKEFELVLI